MNSILSLIKSLTITDKQNSGMLSFSSASSNSSSLLLQTISGTQQSTEASTNIEKMLGKGTTNFSSPISSIYSDLAKPTTNYQILGTLIADNNLSTVYESECSPILTNLPLSKIDSNTQLNTTFPFNSLQQASFSNAKTTANMLEEAGLKDSSKVKKKEVASSLQIQKNNSIAGWVRLTPNKIILATPDDVWVYRPNSKESSNLFTQSSNNASDIAITKKLLDTAIILGKREASSNHRLPALNLNNWVWSLINQYHSTHSTAVLMEEASIHFAARGNKHLAAWAEQKAVEETGHDRLALLDIQSLGYKAQDLVKAFMSPSAKSLLDYFVSSVENPDPIGVVGYSYTLERISLAVKKRHIQAIEAIIPRGINATRCLRVHSSIGSDVEHVEETIEMVARLTPAERNNIAIACYETARLYFSTSEQDFPLATQLQEQLQPFKL
jgi:pyrroloquinoline quinone (PQQ) biosynthesis protein C